MRYITLILLLSCGFDSEPDIVLNTQYLDLEPFKQRFLDDYYKYKGKEFRAHRTVVVKDGKVPQLRPDARTFAVCDRYTDGSRIVVIQPQLWLEIVDDNARYALFLHELGHCLYDLKHRIDIHIMHSTLDLTTNYVDDDFRHRYNGSDFEQFFNKGAF